ncbi:acyl carrier protein [Polynucleobacter sp. AP-Ainpum-60-G11]|uniref:acyl carrier protein n=1 Tax=Polynucleobacter sp. AP-Ainpum-60-G11 TaxID=2576926 RepID=UPI001BFE812B|nr:acyl carrier protein [Polynucleobacter sp. AP-Ainpum-60-G11]QWE27006.1 acyl carrier protein [Polynucleobacter sp. AP-Ainpum-60-G11]
MSDDRLRKLLVNFFPNDEIPQDIANVGVGSFEAWDSLAHFNFLLLVEDEFSIRFSLEQIAELKTISEIEAAINR